MAKKTIAIIGATGHAGSAIAKGLAKGNYRLLLFGDDKKKLNSLAKKIRTTNPLADIDCIGCAADASWEADIIIPTVPFTAQKEIAQKIAAFANRKTVISISDWLNETNTGLVDSTGISAAKELQKLLPGAKVVNAIEALPVAKFFQPVNDKKQNDRFRITDEEEVLKTILEILNTGEFNHI